MVLQRKRNLYFINHNAKIGGRYSIFSDVGMLPAYLMGLKPKILIKKFIF